MIKNIFSITVLSDTEAVATIGKTGAAIQQVLSRVFSKFNTEHQFTGPNAMFGIHLGKGVPQTYRD